jgi:NAD(P)H-dependent flavin oxidoreductase YrpB (nitropropane dioxygenase family)
MPLQTPVCDLFGIEFPVFSAGMGNGAGAPLAAAVSNAGGCGVIGGNGRTNNGLRNEIRQMRALSSKPFGVNLLPLVAREGMIDACIEERPPIIVFFLGDPTPWIGKARQSGIKIFVQVGTVEEARTAARAGADAIIAQGVEAGGHVQATVSLATNLPAIAQAVSPLPVLASGGIATGHGLAAALVLGAQGVSMGTRFVATHEAFASTEYKRRVVSAQAQDTVYLNLFDGGFPPYAPHRVLRNKVVREWETAGRPGPGKRPGENTSVGIVERGGSTRQVARYYSSLATPEFVGDLEYMPLWCGESCTHINEIKPAAEVVHDIMTEAEEVIRQTRRWLLYRD